MYNLEKQMAQTIQNGENGLAARPARYSKWTDARRSSILVPLIEDQHANEMIDARHLRSFSALISLLIEEEYVRHVRKLEKQKRRRAG